MYCTKCGALRSDECRCGYETIGERLIKITREMMEIDNANLGTCGLCGRDPQKLEAEIERLRAELVNSNAQLHNKVVEAQEAAQRLRGDLSSALGKKEK